MLDVLVILVLLAAIGMGIVAFRGWRATLRLAREMIQIRQRILALEDGLRALRAHREEDEIDLVEQRGIDASLGILRERLDVVEGRLAEVARRLAGGTALTLDVEEPLPQEASPLERAVRRHLRAQGFERIVVLDLDEDYETAWIEAERGGVTAKGTASRLSDGRIELATESTVRSFP